LPQSGHESQRGGTTRRCRRGRRNLDSIRICGERREQLAGVNAQGRGQERLQIRCVVGLRHTQDRLVFLSLHQRTPHLLQRAQHIAQRQQLGLHHRAERRECPRAPDRRQRGRIDSAVRTRAYLPDLHQCIVEDATRSRLLPSCLQLQRIPHAGVGLADGIHEDRQKALPATHPRRRIQHHQSGATDTRLLGGSSSISSSLRWARRV
jgi:hypothetical protein